MGKNSFAHLYDGFIRQSGAMIENDPTFLFDYGNLFRYKSSDGITEWKEDKQLFVFLTFTTDGFEIFKSGSMQRSCWPTMFNVLNLDFSYRCRVCKDLKSSLIPVNHSSEYFETFLKPTIDIVTELEKLIEKTFWDGNNRKVFRSILFITAD